MSLLPTLAPAAALLLLSATALADTLTLEPAQDNTLYQYPLGNVSNGKGIYLFSGKTNNLSLRRALLRFDVAAAVPAGATITAVELRLVMSKTMVQLPPAPTSLHRLLAAWGEGASDATGEEGEGAFAEPGDATWLNTFYPGALWAAIGSDYAPVPSATTPVSVVGPYAWSAAQLVADVQHWLDTPADNHGWVLIGVEDAGQTSKRFDSRENPDPATRPHLVIEFTPPSCAGAWTTYGAGLAGAGGSVPALSGTGCPAIGNPVVLELSGGVGGATGALFLGLAPAALPFKGGTFLVDATLQLVLHLGGQPGAAGTGTLTLPAVLPVDPLLQGVRIHLQAALGDGAAVKGASLSQGLRMEIG